MLAFEKSGTLRIHLPRTIIFRPSLSPAMFNGVAHSMAQGGTNDCRIVGIMYGLHRYLLSLRWPTGTLLSRSVDQFHSNKAWPGDFQ